MRKKVTLECVHASAGDKRLLEERRLVARFVYGNIVFEA